MSFVSSDDVRKGAEKAGADPQTTEALVEDYEDAQLQALKTSLLVAAFIVVAAFFATRRLPSRPLTEGAA